MQACNGNSGLGGLVKVLRAKKIDRGQRDKKNDRQMKSFFATLVNLERLELGYKATSLIEIILSPRVARSTLPRLEILKLTTPTPLDDKPLDSKTYRYLSEFPSLHRLELSDSGAQPLTCSSKGGQKLANIKSLVPEGYFVDDKATSSFLQIFPSLASLTLDTYRSHRTAYSELVALLPTSLTSLTLRCLGLYNDHLAPCDQHFPRLVNLEYLYLSEGTFTENLIDALRHLPKLRTLGFGKGAILNCSKLEEMILGPNRLPSLEKVIFDQVEATSKRKWGRHPKGTLSKEEFIKLVHKIKLQGIEVEGTAITAMRSKKAR
ncbi:uncharacterized protein JCM6883_002023 [Sporobolomyces salmoneus]|uniref:uncharacterized protein n=1 Tax=Sporobolomyces salmoneus TaxID=183962 RepID=UPI003177D1A6